MNDDTQQIQLETQKELFDNLRKQEWYIYFIEELEALVTEGEYNARWELLKTYHEVGRVIFEKKQSFNQAHLHNNNIYDIVAEDINKSKATVYKAVEFYKKYPNAMTDVSSLPEGKNLTWSKLINKYLHEPRIITDTSVKKDEADIDIEPIADAQIDTTPTFLSNIDALNFSLREILKLYIETINLLTDNNGITNIFIIYILKKFSSTDLKRLIRKYAESKTENEAKYLNELLEKIGQVQSEQKLTLPTTSPLFENSVPIITHTNTAESKQPTAPPTPIKEFISLYSELYFKKYNRRPLTGSKIYASIGHLLKIKIGQGFSFDEIKILLQLYSKPENSNFCDFAPHPFFSDNVFNKLQAQMNKDNHPELGGKYNKYEIK